MNKSISKKRVTRKREKLDSFINVSQFVYYKAHGYSDTAALLESTGINKDNVLEKFAIQTIYNKAHELVRQEKVKDAIEIAKQCDVVCLTESQLYSAASKLISGIDINGNEVPANVQQRTIEMLLKYQHGKAEKMEVEGNLNIASTLASARKRLNDSNTTDNVLDE